MKKKLFLLLSLVLCASTITMTANASGSSNVRYGSAETTIDHIDLEAFGDYLSYGAIDPEHTRPKDEIIIPLKYEGFRNAADQLIDWGDLPEYGPTVQQMKQSNVSVHLVVAKGHKYIKDVELVKFTPTTRNRTYSAVRVRFVDELVSTQEFAYEFSIQMYVGHRANSVTSEIFGGRFANPTFYAKNNDYVFIGDGTQVKSLASFVDLELDLGNGIRAFVDSSSNEYYYGVAKHLDNIEDEISSEYPQIEEVYDIRSVNLTSSYTRVKIDGQTKEDAMFVYNVAGIFVGMSNETLPFSTRYYLSKTEIAIDPDLIDIKAFEAEAYYLNDVMASAIVTQFTEGLRAAGAVKVTSQLEEGSLELEPGYTGEDSVSDESLPTKAPTIYFRK